jgi:hypothetical protein
VAWIACLAGIVYKIFVYILLYICACFRCIFFSILSFVIINRNQTLNLLVWTFLFLILVKSNVRLVMDYKNLYKLYSDVKKSLFISVSLVCNQSNHFFFNMKKKKKNCLSLSSLALLWTCGPGTHFATSLFFAFGSKKIRWKNKILALLFKVRKRKF